MTVNAIEHRLLQLLADSETPLYSAWRWLKKETGSHLPLDRFLALVNTLITRDQVRLWKVEFKSHDRTEFFEVPSELTKRYTEEGHDDEAYDPFGYSLTLGPDAQIDSEPEWEVDIDLKEGTFQLFARNPELRLDEVFTKLAYYFPDVSLVPIEIFGEEAERRVIGRAS